MPRPERVRVPVLPPGTPQWSADFGPHICPRCYGAGWMVDRDGDGSLKRCDGCETVTNSQLSSCWQISRLKADAPNPPTLDAFESWTPDATAALAAAMAFVRQPHGWLTIHGGPGTGKSHLAEAIARALLARRVPCIYLNAIELWEHLGAIGRLSGDETDYAGRQRHLADVRALVVDEMNVERASDAVFKLRRGLLDHRYRTALQSIGMGLTVLASNDAPERWQDQAIGDRALDRHFVVVHSGTISYRRAR